MSRIYVVEDEQDIAELVRYNLSMGGHDIRIFNSGEEGLQSIKNEKPDLLVLDIMLPGLSGLEVCQKLKAEPTSAAVPIIVECRTKGEEDDIVRGLESVLMIILQNLLARLFLRHVLMQFCDARGLYL